MTTEALRPGEVLRTRYRWRVLLAGGVVVRAGEDDTMSDAYDAMIPVLARQGDGLGAHGELAVRVWRDGTWSGDDRPFARWERHDDGTVSQVAPQR